MKVLQINAVNSIGSTGRTTKQIHDYLKEKKNKSLVAYSEGTYYEGAYKIGTKFEKKIHSLFSRLMGTQGYFSRKSTVKLIEFITKEKPDIIRLGNLHGNYVNIPILLEFLAETDIPTIITLDDCFFFTGKCTHYTMDRCYKWKTGCKQCPRIYKDNTSWFLDRTLKMWKDKKNLYNQIPRLGVVGVSDWITNEAKQSILSSAKYIKRIYNWIDTDVFKPIDTNAIKEKLSLTNKFIILGVASEWKDKGLENFIKVSKFLKEDELIILVGKIPKKVRLSDNIINIQETHNIDELVMYYSMADVFLQLSLEETFGKVGAESLSCGTPIIVFNSTANAEIVGDRCGYIVEPNNILEVVKNIKDVRNNTKDYYSFMCRNFALKNFNKDERISEYIQLFEDLINYKGDI